MKTRSVKILMGYIARYLILFAHFIAIVTLLTGATIINLVSWVRPNAALGASGVYSRIDQKKTLLMGACRRGSRIFFSRGGGVQP